ncbi:hypothetical protein [Veillonella magna]|uniref:hypothetical protein n=1 Tax=Veillonella magna TaxID=464322 RepID=UPI00041EF7AF|nr:hypothetical protein [Veillonella magna]
MQDAVTVQQDANRTEVTRVSSTSAASPFVQVAGIGVDIGSTWAKAVAVDGAGTHRIGAPFFVGGVVSYIYTEQIFAIIHI